MCCCMAGRAVPGEDEAVGRPAAGAGEGGHGRGGGRGAPPAGFVTSLISCYHQVMNKLLT